jgi:hypothetical protein
MATGFNPSDQTGGVAVSGSGNTVATFGATSGIRSVTSHATGKWYFEITVTGTIDPDSPTFGIGSSVVNLFGFPGAGNPSDSVGLAAGNTEEIYYNNGFAGSNVPGVPVVSGNVVSVCVDQDNHLVYFLTPQYITNYGATGWNGLATANPATQVGGVGYSLTTSAFIQAYAGSNGSVLTLNSGQSGFLRAPPSGFSAWDNWATAQTGQAFISGAGGMAGAARIRATARGAVAGSAAWAGILTGSSTGSGAFRGASSLIYSFAPAILVGTGTSTDSGSGIIAAQTASLAGTGTSTDTASGLLSTPSIPTNALQTQNLLVDAMLRGQPLVAPTTWYIALVTTLGDAMTPGTEVTGSGYARVSVAANFTNWCGTQGVGTTVASTGTSGMISNNARLAFPPPSADWGTVIGYEFWDAPIAGNRWLAGRLQQGLTISNGDPARGFAIGALSVSIG